tara:strand:- start:1255 stop:1419 length:165 start_codon:yes stop_codon:yes gene_type:complete
MVKVAGTSSLVVILRLFAVGGCGAGSLLVGDEQVQIKIAVNMIESFFILIYSNP